MTLKLPEKVLKNRTRTLHLFIGDNYGHSTIDILYSFPRCYGIAPASYLQLARLPTLLCLNIMGLISPPAVNEVR